MEYVSSHQTWVACSTLPPHLINPSEHGILLKSPDMGAMFSYASAFNQPIGAWNTARVTDMGGMFYHASAFNQPIGAWNTSRVTTTWVACSPMPPRLINPSEHGIRLKSPDMGYMFYHASAFNQPIGAWNTAQVTDMSLHVLPMPPRLINPSEHGIRLKSQT